MLFWGQINFLVVLGLNNENITKIILVYHRSFFVLELSSTVISTSSAITMTTCGKYSFFKLNFLVILIMVMTTVNMCQNVIFKCIMYHK